jgi:hypothetical protein
MMCARRKEAQKDLDEVEDLRVEMAKLQDWKAGMSKVMWLVATAAGGMWVEIQGPDGKAIEGFSLQDCTEIIGDRLEHTVRWKDGTDVSTLRGKPVRLRVRMKDADLYSFRFVEAG